MHARGCPGAHVLLRTNQNNYNNEDPSSIYNQECLQYAANLAVFYSDARTETNGAYVTVAEPRHIKKPRGAPPGAVSLRQELMTLIGRPNDVPDELKSK
eukprot:8407751-Ditylum_brightwellii.AAC.1